MLILYALGRIDDEKGVRRTRHQTVMSKIDRRNQAKQRQLVKRKEHLEETRVFSGRDGAPRIVAVIPLCSDSDARSAIRCLNDSLDIEADVGGSESSFRVPVERFKQKLQYVPVKRDLNMCLDAARVADFVVVLLSAAVEVDQLGELILRSIETQGLSTMYTALQHLGSIEQPKQRPQVVSSLKSFITHFHPDQVKLCNLENRQECSNLMRALCNTTPKGVRWRDDRSWMLADHVRVGESDPDTTVLTGVVRGRGLKADRLVQIGDWGTFQISKITAAPLPAKDMEEAPADEILLDVPSNDCDDLAEVAPGDVLMQHDGEEGDDAASLAKKGVLLDDHRYFEEGDGPEDLLRTRVPKGTSGYQSAWYLGDDASEDGSDYEDLEMADEQETPAEAIEGEDGNVPPEPTEMAPSEYAQSAMVIEPDENEDARQLEAYRASKRSEVEDDMEFPDEIELQPNVLARERLARYRGLRSFRDSVWQQHEDRAHEPEDWRRLLQIPDYTASRSRSTREALVGGVTAGTRVNIHISGVPRDLIRDHVAGAPITLFSLLRHENKRTAVNYLVNMSSDYPKSIKSKEELIVQCGPRRFVINPLFSHLGTTPNDVHKYCRWLHPGQSAVATFIGPVTWGSVPVLFFKRSSGQDEQAESSEEANTGLTLVGTGTSLPPSTSRIIAKRIVLTGHPFHIHKKIVTIRYMFFNKEDVDWFKALTLWTKRGRRGEVRESLGTHGYFKAIFDGRINPQDSVGVSLYKRVWPRNATVLSRSLLEGPPVHQGNDSGEMELDEE